MRFNHSYLERSSFSFLTFFYDNFSNLLIRYPTPKNLSYFWNFGFLSGLVLVIQLISGIFLSMHYTGNIEYAFMSINYILKDVPAGWFVRYVHSNGASMFFLVVYIHIFRNLYYGSYRSPRGLLWSVGVVIFILLMGTAFLGYVLPWGQMSYWGATVITNFVTVIPFVGHSLVEWVWGGFTINNATLTRFYSLHYLLPFIIAALSFLHILFLHEHGSNNPTGFFSNKVDKIYFYPYYYTKDLFGFIVFLMVYSFFIFFYPDFLGHSDNYIEANPFVTPSHIVPEWYLLPYYAMLRSIPNKVLGIVAMFGSLVILFFLPILDKSLIKSSQFRPIYRKLFWVFIANFLLLGFIGSQEPIYPFIELGLIGTHFYFLFFLSLPFICFLEQYLLPSVNGANIKPLTSKVH
jgi:ubiquinol-cytochrome c reductase cytochrome b subunit